MNKQELKEKLEENIADLEQERLFLENEIILIHHRLKTIKTTLEILKIQEEDFK